MQEQLRVWKSVFQLSAKILVAQEKDCKYRFLKHSGFVTKNLRVSRNKVITRESSSSLMKIIQDLKAIRQWLSSAQMICNL
jgi:hypothetical protein